MPVLLLQLLPQLYEARLSELRAGGKAVRLHKGMEILRQLLQISAQILDIPADGNDIGVCGVDILTQFPQTARDMRQIRLRNHPITHTFPFFLPMIRDDYSIDCRFREAGNLLQEHEYIQI